MHLLDVAAHGERVAAVAGDDVEPPTKSAGAAGPWT